MILRVLAGAFLVAFAAACALVEVLYLPLRAGVVPIPLSVISAAALNVIFTRAMYVLTGSVIAALLPGAAWLAVVARSATARPEGDLLLSSDDSSTLFVVNVAFLLLGVLGLAYSMATMRGHFPSNRAKPRLGGAGRHVHRRWRFGRTPKRGSHAAPRHRERAEVSQPPETAGIT